MSEWTKRERQDLESAVRTAKHVVDVLEKRQGVKEVQDVAIGALARAVELLAKPRNERVAVALGELRSSMQPGKAYHPETMFRSIVDVLEMLAGLEPQQQPTTKAEAVELTSELVAAAYASDHAMVSTLDNELAAVARDFAEKRQVQCVGCGRVAACVRVSDGTMYKPTAWVYPSPHTPMRGVCGQCQLLTWPTNEPQEASTNPTLTFSDELVERLCVAYVAAYDAHPEEHTFERQRFGIRAILSEFASMPCELPTVQELSDLIWSGASGEVVGDKSRRVLNFLRARLAPVLAAKDAEIARALRSEMHALERMGEANAILGGDENELIENTAKRAAKRLADLESRTPANEVQNAERTQYETTIEQQRKRIEELDNLRVDADEKHAVAQWYISSLEKWKEDNKRFTDEWHEAIDVLCELWPRDEPIEANPPQGDWIRRLVAVREKRAVAELEKELADVRTTEQERRLEIASHRGIVAELEKRLADSEASRKAADAMVDARQKRIQELEKCLAEATAVPTVDGKTPGRVLYDELWKQLSSGNEEMFRMEAGAKAVLRAFGGQALRRVRERIDVTERMSNDTEYGKEWIHRGETLAIINDELAKLGGQTKSQPTPELRSAAAGDCCMNCYNSHGDCADHGNCECHTGRQP
jgi:hypothetical protein